jgi:molecular chaperone DnaJ
LGVNIKATQTEIKKARNEKIKKIHPDIMPSEDKEFAEETIKKINHAYEVLSISIKRKEYDRMIGI